jgi:hypothetical protein
MKTWSVLDFLPKKVIPAALLIVVVFFGLVAVIYEEKSRYEDKIARLLSAEEVALYLHADKNDKTTTLWQSLPKELTAVWREQYPEFFTEWEAVQKLASSEYAFVLLRNQASLNPVWLLYWPVKNSVKFTTDQVFSRFGDIIILGKEAPAVVRMLTNRENSLPSLSDYMQSQDSQSTTAAYAYINFDIWPSKPNEFFTKGRWRLQIKPSQIEAWSLENLSDQQLVISDSDWLQTFFNEPMVWQKLNPEDVRTMLTQKLLLPFAHEQLTRFASMNHFNTNDFITHFVGPADLVVSSASDDSVFWLVRTPWSDDILTEINKNIKQLIGFASPTLATSTLPDGTLAREYKAIPRDFIYQILPQINQEVQIVYLNNQDYFIWIKQGDYLIFGNSLKLLNRYLSKSQQTDISKKNCLMPGGKGVMIGSGLANSSENPVIVREIWNNRSLKYRLCF